MTVIEVFADVGCPFTHVGLLRLQGYRREHGREDRRLRVRAWPLELVNGHPLSTSVLAPEIVALRREVAPDRFAGFDADTFPTTTLPALAAAAAAYRSGLEVGEQFSFAVRHALFEEGLDVSDDDVLRHLRADHGIPDPTAADHAAVRADYDDGRDRNVTGSPYFVTPGGEFFCPALSIRHDAGQLEVAFDADGFQRFVAAAFA